MQLNKIQIAIFKKMAREANLELDEFIETNSGKYTGKEIPTIEQLTEEEADTWINKAYLESLEK